MIYMIAKIVGAYYAAKSIYTGGKIINSGRKLYYRMYPNKPKPPRKNKIVIIDRSMVKTEEVKMYVSRGRSKSI